MFTINLDKKRELWKSEIDKSDFEWKMLSDLKGVGSGVAEKYNIHGIPATFLISPEGKIISRSLRREGSVEYFKKLFTK